MFRGLVFDRVVLLHRYARCLRSSERQGSLRSICLTAISVLSGKE